MTKINQIDVTLHVESLENSFEWYQEKFGWYFDCDAINDNNECIFGSVSSNKDPWIGLNLVKTNKVTKKNNFHLLLKVGGDINALFNNLSNKNVEIVNPLKKYNWGISFSIKDLNGFVLEFWSELSQ